MVNFKNRESRVIEVLPKVVVAAAGWAGARFPGVPLLWLAML
tara:strand:+ start:52 stop:177 length:126 start_codon:yes stop_codon:yes gene_type:complete